MGKNKLEELKEFTTIVADTGEIEAIKQYRPRDATTNPSLLLKAAQLPEYQHIVAEAVEWAKTGTNQGASLVENVIVRLFVLFGVEILKIVEGRVSTEVDARLSFDVDASLKRAREYIALYEDKGIGRERILVKLASTWEGIRAAEILEKEGIHCNMTLLFNMGQAVAAAEANATLISPFVGRIFDWQKQKEGKESIPADEDMGVMSVHGIYNYYKKFGYKTQIMGASFRNTGEILELAGCDLLTIAPTLLKELSELEGPVVRKLDPNEAMKCDAEKIHVDEARYRWELCNDEMASFKLYEGIRNFYKDYQKLETYLTDHFINGKKPQAKAM